MIPIDPTDEIREIKHKLAEEDGNDIHRIAESARRRQHASGKKSVKPPASELDTSDATNQSLHPTGASLPDSL